MDPSTGPELPGAGASLPGWRVDTPSPVYLTGEDFFRIVSANSLAGVTLVIRGRVMLPSGRLVPFIETHTPNTDRSAKATTFVLPEGWLLGVQVSTSAGNPLVGQTYVMLELVRGSRETPTSIQAITQGYVSNFNRVGWPGYVGGSALDGRGIVRSIAGTAPGAGNEVSETVPTGACWEVLSFRLQFGTSAAVANRTVQLLLDDGATEYYRDSPAVLQAASLADIYCFSNGGSKLAAPFATAIGGNLPADNRLLAGHRIRTTTTNLQAGDLYTAIQYLVREWLDV
jgi:hypothetical protein